MRRSPRYAFALALLSVLSLALLFHSSPTSAQKTIPPACVSVCQQKLYECNLQYGPNTPRCISAYRSCIARCK